MQKQKVWKINEANLTDLRSVREKSEGGEQEVYVERTVTNYIIKYILAHIKPTN